MANQGSLLVVEVAVGDLQIEVFVRLRLCDVAMLSHRVWQRALLVVGDQKVAHSDHPFFLYLSFGLQRSRIVMLVEPVRIIAKGHLQHWAGDLDPHLVLPLA